ncbi:MAG: hypothetical protein AAFP79_08675 [Pseudomonadota bacterium]
MSAEDDEEFLKSCYINTGTSDKLSSIGNPECIALGRTGSGKSAALIHISGKQNNVRSIEPESLSLNYISNSTVIKYLEDIGIDLGIFYQLLWRHVLVVELLKMKKEFNDARNQQSWLTSLFGFTRDNPKRKAALEYLTSFGDSFWLDTELRIREIVNRIETKIEDEIGGKITDLLPGFPLSIEGKTRSSSDEERTAFTEVVNKAQRAVNSVQLQQLNEVISFLSDDVFDDKKQSYYLVIDNLDEGWVHDNLRFKLIRALIETIKKFRKIRNVKIVISLRADLLETVLENTTASGFQTEKFEDLMVRMNWSDEELRELVDLRLNRLFQDQYTQKTVGCIDVFPGRIGDVDAFTYMLHRSMRRPRDLIAYINECLAISNSGKSIGTKSLRQAEASFSRRRVRALADEWRGAYGDLEVPFRILSKLESRFEFRDVTDDLLEELCIQIVAGDETTKGRFARECEIISKGDADYRRLRRTFFETMYVVGAVGYRRLAGTPMEWSFINEPILTYAALQPETPFAIHPMLHKEFGMRGDAKSFFT